MRQRNDRDRKRKRRHRIEWPTVAVAVLIYAGFLAVTWFHDSLTAWLTIPLGAWLGAWHASLQHEIVHGHPTPWRRINRALARPCLVLWLPFGMYRTSHLAHHVDRRLTDPLEDPESYYVTADAWARMGRSRRALLWIHNTLLGRFIFGPPRMIWQALRSDFPRLCRGERSRWRDWTAHTAGVLLVAGWAFGMAGMPLWEYALGFVYGGTALMLLRSFLEHQAAETIPERTVVVEAELPFRLLFLNNNLHAVHHDRPAVPWYRLPQLFKASRGDYLDANGCYRYDGYLTILKCYLLRAKEPPVHPLYPMDKHQQHTPFRTQNAL